MGMVFTVGHSTHLVEHFVGLLKQHDVAAIADVRSKPYSRRNPQFNRDDLKETLGERDIAYVFLGQELGARSADKACYHAGKVRYDLLAQTDLFNRGLERVREGARTYRLALMCAEKDPLECHRTILIARHLSASGIEVQHIHGDGRLEGHAEVMCRLVRQLHLPERDMFRVRDEIVAEAYRLQEERIAYSVSEGAPEPRAARSEAP